MPKTYVRSGGANAEERALVVAGDQQHAAMSAVPA